MAERVVDVLEVIDVDVEQAERLAGPTRLGNTALQQMLELHAIGNLGQRIYSCEVANAFFGAAPLRDVLRCIDPVAFPDAVVIDNGTSVGHGYRLAVPALKNCLAR